MITNNYCIKYHYFTHKSTPASRTLKTNYILNFNKLSTTRSILDLKVDMAFQNLKLCLKRKLSRCGRKQKLKISEKILQEKTF